MELKEPTGLKMTVEKIGNKYTGRLVPGGKAMTTKVIPQIEEIINLYELIPGNKKVITDFLSEHQQLIPVLINTISHIKQIFGESDVRLELNIDPEEGWSELWGIIISKKPRNIAHSLLERLDREWLAKLNRESRIGIDLNFDVEFK